MLIVRISAYSKPPHKLEAKPTEKVMAMILPPIKKPMNKHKQQSDEQQECIKTEYMNLKTIFIEISDELNKKI